MVVEKIGQVTELPVLDPLEVTRDDQQLGPYAVGTVQYIGEHIVPLFRGVAAGVRTAAVDIGQFAVQPVS